MARHSLGRTLRDARAHSRQGEIAEARAIVQSILKDQPDNREARAMLRALGQPNAPPKALHPPKEILSGLAAQLGRAQFAEVSQSCEVLARAYPASFVVWNLWGIAAQGQGRREAALAHFRKAADLNPKYPDARYNQGVLLQLAGALAPAEAAYRQAVAIKPDHADALNNLGFLCLAQGRPDEAVRWLTAATAARKDFAEAENNLGSALIRLGKAGDALAAFGRALALKPGFAAARVNVGNLHLETGDAAAAVAAFERVLAADPRHVEAQDNLGVALRILGRADAAVAAHRRAVVLAPGRAEARYHLGLALKLVGRQDEAVAALDATLALAPDHAKAANARGVTLQELGRIDEAVGAYRHALAIQPDFAEAYLNLCQIAPIAADDPLWAHMHVLHDAGTLSEADLCNLCFALANTHDRQGDVATAFRYLQQGNALRKALLGYDPAQDRQLFGAILHAAPALAGAGAVTRRAPLAVTPIFILGMPRSGTTLFEQVISAHPQVTGGGEIDLVARLGEDLATGRTPPDRAAIEAFRQAYLAGLAELADGRPFVTDKTPHNFLFLGLIATALPEARIVHVTRDAAATCWSNYWQNFLSSRIGYCYDLGDVVAYHGMYRDMMAAWQTMAPGRVLEADYDALTAEPEPQMRRLIAGLGLAWSDDCLAPHRNTRAVRTASNVQVRQAIYQGSSQKWRRYAPFLDGALDGLAGQAGSASLASGGGA
jgi:tetratricopeptide (TPR) repeat protein